VRVNIYAEELTDRVEIISKVIDGRDYTAVRFYLELPTTVYVCPEGVESVTSVFESSGPDVEPSHCAGCGCDKNEHRTVNVAGSFIHREGDDDSAAVTLTLLDEYYGQKEKLL
jgi:hypothetical protein